MRRVLNKDESYCVRILRAEKENLDGNQVRLLSCGTLPTSSTGIGAFPGFPGRFVHLLASFVSLWTLLRIRGFCVFEFGNSAQQQPVCYLMSFFSILSSFQDEMHCQLSITVCTCTACQRASFKSTTDSFRGVMTPTLLPVRPGLHSTNVGLL